MPHRSIRGNGLRGLKTLGVRVERQCANAQAVAEFLHRHPSVQVVHYPGLPSHPQFDQAQRQLQSGGGCVSFEVAGGYAAAAGFAEALELAELAPSLGGPETLVNHPASMTHAALDPARREAVGISDGLIRMSMGLEHPDDVLRDVCQALEPQRT